GWVGLRGWVTAVSDLERLTYRVDQALERTVDVTRAADGSGTFDVQADGLTLGEPTLIVRAHDRRGGVHVAPTITVLVVPAIREIPIPESAASAFPADINERGEVTGYWTEIERPAWHAFLYTSGETRQLGDGGEFRSAAPGLNDHGDVVGYNVA